jgi:carboxylate-amine ligase
MDAVSRVEDALAIAAYVQALVKRYSEDYEAHGHVPSYHRILTSENKWLAARYGLEAPLMNLATGSRNRVSAAQLIRGTLREIEPHARDLGSERELEGIRRILRDGNGADEQLRTFQETRDLVEVTRAIAALTEHVALVAA